MWQSTTIQPFRKSTIERLIKNKIPAVVFKGFANKQHVEQLKFELTNHALRTHSITDVTRLGISQYQQGLCVSKENYFTLSRKLHLDFKPIFTRSFCPVQRIINYLVELGFNAAVMEEPRFGYYFAGNGKLREGNSPIHVDFAPQDSAGWAIAETQVQLAWNLYLDVPEKGGELLLWDKQWHKKDDTYQVKNNYFFHEGVVKGIKLFKVKVRVGDVVMLNSRNYHAISKVKKRLSFGSFISVFDDKSMGLWS